MKRSFLHGVLLACALGAVFSAPAAAQQSVAVMPSLYFSADAESADNVTNGIVQQFEGQGYSVIPMDRSRSTFHVYSGDFWHANSRSCPWIGCARLYSYPRPIGHVSFALAVRPPHVLL